MICTLKFTVFTSNDGETHIYVFVKVLRNTVRFVVCVVSIMSFVHTDY